MARNRSHSDSKGRPSRPGKPSFGHGPKEKPRGPEPRRPSAGEAFSYEGVPYTPQRRPRDAQEVARQEEKQRSLRDRRTPGEPYVQPQARREEKKSRSDRPQGERTKKDRAGGSKTQRLVGFLQKHPKGFGFLNFEGGEFEDLFLPPPKAAEFFHGDRIAVTILPNGEVLNFEVVDHLVKEVFGRYTPEAAGPHDRGAWITFERRHIGEKIYCPEGAKGTKPGQWVKVRLHFHDSGRYRVTGEVIQTYGEELPASMDVEWVATELGLVEHHPKEVVEEAAKLQAPTEADLRARRDLRKLPLITIDGITARDFDDAVYVEVQGNTYVLWVAIADVSHYVREGTALDTEAYGRATSVYFPERAFHMLPSNLSENLCSLRPDVDRLCMVARMTFDSTGARLETEVMEGVMRSKRRATYEEIQEEYVKSGGRKDWEFAHHFALYKLLRAKKTKRGAVDFDLPEAKIMVDETGEPTSIEKTERFDSHKLIEEFMIAANEAVTEWAMARKMPFIYRVHEEPSAESLGRFRDLAAMAGVRFDIERAQKDPRVVADVVKELEEHPAKTMLNSALLRSMKQAVYSAEHGIHFGLASKAYTHFTSPIRRYPDLLVHRVLKIVVRREKFDRDALEEKLAVSADHCSHRERLAAQAERESTKLKQVRFMTRRLGDEYHGIISGMHEKGLFIQLGDAHDAPFVEGLVPKDTLTDDIYAFNEERLIYYGKRKKRTMRIGDDVRVRVARANLERREIEFELLEHKEGEMVTAAPRPTRKERKAAHQERRKQKGKGRAKGRG